MAHTRKDTLITPPQWWKHLRPYYKRVIAKAERKEAKEQIKLESNEIICEICNGTGNSSMPSSPHRKSSKHKCQACDGTGKLKS